jgi:monodehydroascorbate reductase (NADH)
MGRCNPQSLAVPDSLKHLDGLGDVQVLYKTSVTSVDLLAKTVKTSSGKSLHYDKLIIATGATASKLPESIGGSLPGVHYIREVADADALVTTLSKKKKVVVIGGGYIGMEVAAALTAWKIDTTVCFMQFFLLKCFPWSGILCVIGLRRISLSSN